MKPPSLKKDALLSIAISILPSLIGIVSVPFIIKNLGLERFAFLSLIWALAGYFGIFDLGLGRSLSKRTAFRHSNKEYNLLGREVTFGLLIISGVSIAIAAGLLIFGGHLIDSFSHISDSIRPEATNSLMAVAASLPFFILSTTTKGVLEGLHAFSEANTLQIVNGLANFLVPWWVSIYSADLFSTVFALSLVRVMICIASITLLAKKIPLRFGHHWDSSLIFDGGWLTLSAISSPIMVYIDRFLLTTMIPLKSLAFYTTPVDLVNRLSILPQGISRVSFPTFSYYKEDKEQIQNTFEHSLDLMIFFCLPTFLFVNFFAGEILHYWISLEMEMNGRIVLLILSIGLFWNCLGWVSYSYLQATNGVRLAALIATAEIPFYLLFLYFASLKWGYVGAGAIWALRFVADAIVVDCYFLFRYHIFKEQILKKMKTSILYTILCTISWLSLEVNVAIRVAWGAILFSTLGLYLWKNKKVLRDLKK